MSRIRVLVADDDPVLRDALEALIGSDESMELVGAAQNASEAVEMAVRHRPDVAVLDVRMPDGGGPKAAVEIRELSPSTRVLAFSAFEDRSTVIDMLRSGAVGYLLKGTRPQDILEGIRRSFLGESTLSTEITSDVVDELATQLTRDAREAERLAHQADRIRAVLAGDGLIMAFQPIVDLRGGQISGMEALSRFAAEPKRGPDVWFAEAAEVGLQAELDMTAARAALAELDRLPHGAYLSVNLSPETVLSSSFEEMLREVHPERIVVEVTEHARVEDYEALADAFRGLRDGGGRLAIDDAGAGFASLRHILRLAPDIIKLDISLTRGIDADEASQALADALVTFASRIGATIVAEGIETPEELAALRELGVSHGQGYHLARPGPLPVEDALLSSLTRVAASDLREPGFGAIAAGGEA
jgi:EAL domain-containing protein (putative c-di-GMP-specific phosphodiesterase class I)/AmiR/NasT family two-component response regulator